MYFVCININLFDYKMKTLYNVHSYYYNNAIPTAFLQIFSIIIIIIIIIAIYRMWLREEVIIKNTYFKIFFGRSSFFQTIRDTVLVDQFFYIFERFRHALDGQKRSQVGGVRRDHDKREEPPYARHQSCGHSAKRTILN